MVQKALVLASAASRAAGIEEAVALALTSGRAGRTPSPITGCGLRPAACRVCVTWPARRWSAQAAKVL
ncbi:hypothetical protein GCM10020229_00320 [Kitasatospora albolonga]